MICSTATSPYNKDLKIHHFRVRVGVNYPCAQSLIRVDSLLPRRNGQAILPGRTVTPLSHLGNNGRFFYNYMAKIFAYPYPQAETVYLKVSSSSCLYLVAVPLVILKCHFFFSNISTLLLNNISNIHSEINNTARHQIILLRFQTGETKETLCLRVISGTHIFESLKQILKKIRSFTAKFSFFSMVNRVF